MIWSNDTAFFPDEIHQPRDKRLIVRENWQRIVWLNNSRYISLNRFWVSLKKELDCSFIHLISYFVLNLNYAWLNVINALMSLLLTFYRSLLSLSQPFYPLVYSYGKLATNGLIEQLAIYFFKYILSFAKKKELDCSFIHLISYFVLNLNYAWLNVINALMSLLLTFYRSLLSLSQPFYPLVYVEKWRTRCMTLQVTYTDIYTPQACVEKFKINVI